MKEKSLDLLKVLTETPGVSGYEWPIRQVLAGYLAGTTSELSTDKLGSLIAVKNGTNTHPKIMLASHMDEVGFMVTSITDEGFIKFLALGGWWNQVLLDQRVEILTSEDRVMGVIGAKAPHILTPEERKEPMKIKAMFIDVGAAGKEDAEAMGIKQGDPIVPFSPFMACKNSKSFMGKALDNRAGCATIVEIFERLAEYEHDNTVYGVMTVQEEVGLRGAATSVNVVKPDAAIAVDVTVGTDTPGISDNDIATKTYLGKGPIIGFYDATMIPHIKFRDFVVAVAKENHIPYQVEVMTGGGTDAGKIHVYRQGVPTIVIGIPVRYIHDHVGVANIEDYANGVELIFAIVKALDAATMERINDKL